MSAPGLVADGATPADKIVSSETVALRNLDHVGPSLVDFVFGFTALDSAEPCQDQGNPRINFVFLQALEKRVFEILEGPPEPVTFVSFEDRLTYKTVSLTVAVQLHLAAAIAARYQTCKKVRDKPALPTSARRQVSLARFLGGIEDAFFNDGRVVVPDRDFCRSLVSIFPRLILSDRSPVSQHIMDRGLIPLWRRAERRNPFCVESLGDGVATKTRDAEFKDLTHDFRAVRHKNEGCSILG